MAAPDELDDDELEDEELEDEELEEEELDVDELEEDELLDDVLEEPAPPQAVKAIKTIKGEIDFNMGYPELLFCDYACRTN